ncbi:MAG: hypothetical protein HDR09_22090 [Lachnospiraceae bacterium]|nr:hypothetical protein [Lachnospiraceae bacterium]
MKNLLFTRIPSICICFTLIVIGNWGLNLLWGGDVSFFLPVLFVWLVACQLIDLIISKVEFRKWSHYCITESAVLYLLSLFVYRLFIWDSMDIFTLVSFTVIFLVTDGFVFWYFHKRQEIQAEEINQLIHAMKADGYLSRGNSSSR